METVQLRLMNHSDIADACELSMGAGWNQTREDWQMLLEVAPDACFGIEVGGRLVSSTTLLCYERILGWVGMVLTRAEYRGRGFARRLLKHTLDYADSLGIQTLKLDATDQGKPLYEQVGFSTEQPIERWNLAAHKHSIASGSAGNFKVHQLDRVAFAADRSKLIAKHALRSAVVHREDGFLMARPGRWANYVGPCIASAAATAEEMIGTALRSTGDASWYWDLLPANKEATRLAHEMGFVKQRALTRMARGNPLRGRDELVFAVAGFELG